MARMTGGQALVASLHREGVRVIFGLPGVQLYGAIAALRGDPASASSPPGTSRPRRTWPTAMRGRGAASAWLWSCPAPGS